MTVTTHAAVSFFFCFHLRSSNIITTPIQYITYFMAHSFYAFLAPPIFVGVLLTRKSLDPEYKTTAFFSDVFPTHKKSLIFGSIPLNGQM